MKIDLQKKGMESLLNAFESDVLGMLWAQGGLTGRDIFDRLGKKHGLAYSSVVVSLDRLHAKGLLEREIARGKGGLKYTFTPKYSREEFGNRIADQFLSFLRHSFGEPSTAYLNKKLNEKKKAK